MTLRLLLIFFIVVDKLLVSCEDSSTTDENSASFKISAWEEDTNIEAADSTSKKGNTEYSTSHQPNIYSDKTTTTKAVPQNISKYEPSLTSAQITSTTQIYLELQQMLEHYSKKDNTQETEGTTQSKLFTTLMNIEEDHNMSFDKMAKIFVEENKEVNLDKKRRRMGNVEQMDVYADLEDDLADNEFVEENSHYKSLGIEPLALIVLPDTETKSSLREIATSRYNPYEKTSFLLTLDTEMESAPFQMESKSAKQLELQDEDITNMTHMAAFLKKSPENTLYLLPPLTVELEEESNLILNPNERQEIAFEVTNNLNSASRVTFTVRDELGILLEIDRYIAVLGPQASTTVRVTVLPKSGQRSDRITFIASGSEQVRKDVLVDIENNYIVDTDPPFVDYTYTSDCTDVVLSKCKEGTWTIKISAKDDESGLKLLTTIPRGLYFPDGYTSGTREEVTGVYSESCCNADLQIIAIDRMNNRYARQINAYRAPLSFWAVIAIVSVSLIFLAIIIVSSLICLNKCKKNEADSFDLPTYRGGRSRY